jgi:tetratricopeptide (TPR) repeat protein
MRQRSTRTVDRLEPRPTAPPGPPPVRPNRRRPLVALLLIVAANVAIVAGLARVLAPGRRGHWDEVQRARTHLEHGRPDRALEAVSGIRDEAPGAAEGLTLAAQALLELGHISSARAALERSLVMRPDQADAAKMLAAIYLAAGDGRRGLDLLQRAARLDPDDFRPWYAMGKVHHDLGELPESADAYAQALRRAPPPDVALESRIGRVRALLDANQHDAAIDDLASIERAAPDDPRVRALAARQARALGRGDAALEHADATLRRDPDNVDALFVRAQIRHVAGQHEQALADLERAAALNVNHLGVLQLLAQVHARLGHAAQASEARARLEQARARTERMDRLTRDISARPDDPLPRWEMGQLALEGGLDVLAYQCFQAALDIDPNYKPALESLAAMRTEGRAPEAAKPLLPGGSRAVPR